MSGGWVNLSITREQINGMHPPGVDVREMASNDHSEEYLPTLIDGRGCLPLQSIEFPAITCRIFESKTVHTQNARWTQLATLG